LTGSVNKRIKYYFKGVVHFKKNFVQKMSMSFFRKEIKVFDENIPGFFSI